MTTACNADVSRLRTELKMLTGKAETAFERAFDLQQAGAPAERVDAALAEVTRLQEAARSLRERLHGDAVLH
jgi:hypothetical protein